MDKVDLALLIAIIGCILSVLSLLLFYVKCKKMRDINKPKLDIQFLDKEPIKFYRDEEVHADGRMWLGLNVSLKNIDKNAITVYGMTLESPNKMIHHFIITEKTDFEKDDEIKHYIDKFNVREQLIAFPCNFAPGEIKEFYIPFILEEDSELYQSHVRTEEKFTPVNLRVRTTDNIEDEEFKILNG